jgi:hypothetical protein
MTDYAAVLVFFQKFGCTGEGDLVEVAHDFLFRHTNTAVADNELFFFRAEDDLDGGIANFAAHFAALGEYFEFGRSVNGVGNQFPQENLVVRVEEFFNNGKNILGLYGDSTCLHKNGMCLVNIQVLFFKFHALWLKVPKWQLGRVLLYISTFGVLGFYIPTAALCDTDTLRVSSFKVNLSAVPA